MALFKIFRGTDDELKSVPYHDGYAYFCTDNGALWIDIGNNAGDRVRVNAYSAEVLTKGTKEIDVDDIFLTDMIASVAQGGTGANTLTVNALMIGNGTNPVKMVKIDENAVVIGHATNGVAGLKGTGALFAGADGIPKFDILPILLGGTGATTQGAARTNLDVYSKGETNTKVDEVTTVSYTATLSSNMWVGSGDIFTYTYSNTALKCGKNGNVPPIVTYTSNLDEYSKIDSAEATAGVGIVFTSSKKPASDIGIIVIDNK